MPQRQGKHERERTLNWILKLKELQFFYIQRKLCLNRNRSKIFRWKGKHLVLKYNTYSDPRLEKSLSHNRIPTHPGLGNREIPFRVGWEGRKHELQDEEFSAITDRFTLKEYDVNSAEWKLTTLRFWQVRCYKIWRKKSNSTMRFSLPPVDITKRKKLIVKALLKLNFFPTKRTCGLHMIFLMNRQWDLRALKAKMFCNQHSFCS